MIRTRALPNLPLPKAGLLSLNILAAPHSAARFARNLAFAAKWQNVVRTEHP
ncbi:MAG: hypothetical protein IT373_30835 [Polyangiaceae bacterium]|nr:hypothetical protein [Polyangiaceae bacterium]